MTTAEGLKSIVRATIPRGIRNSLRSPSKSAVWLWDAARYSLGATRRLQLAPDLSIVCHPHAYRVFYQAQVADAEQAEEFQGFVSRCSAQMLLFDIGAHFGVFSLAAAHFGGRAVAVDPSPIAARMMKRQCRLNGYTKSIRIIEAAVTDAEGSLGMLSSGVFSDGYFKVVSGRSKSELRRAESVTIDQMTRQFGAPTHVKIDVEGHEGAVIRGAKETLSRFSPALFLELHNEMVRREGGDPNFALDELAGLGYSISRSDGEMTHGSIVMKKPIARIMALRRAK